MPNTELVKRLSKHAADAVRKAAERERARLAPPAISVRLIVAQHPSTGK